MKTASTAMSFAGAAAVIFATGAALGARPANPAATSWTAQINRVAEQRGITTHGSAGAPVATICEHINGHFGVAGVRGWYCLSAGRIYFVHTSVSTGATARAFAGDESDAVIGRPLDLGGSGPLLISAFGDLA